MKTFYDLISYTKPGFPHLCLGIFRDGQDPSTQGFVDALQSQLLHLLYEKIWRMKSLTRIRHFISQRPAYHLRRCRCDFVDKGKAKAQVIVSFG